MRFKYKIVERSDFRDYFQPSRLVLIVTKSNNQSGINISTVAFNMHCSYDPPMFAFALQKGSYSLELLKSNNYCIACIPGEELLQTTIFCGENSGRNMDKADTLKLELTKPENIRLPIPKETIGFFELKIKDIVDSGDHELILSNVLSYNASDSISKGLLSIGANINGYKLLLKSGIHRIAVVNDNREK
jgi:flavin reductase (DIM6/NTAB) family NADH-FMN oxidoreductase RutF